jgi:DNA-directed RNA polymerase specialized sigma24 family protein
VRDAAAAELVKLHYFAGFTLEEVADILGISPRSAYRSWAYARAWLFRRLGGEGAGRPDRKSE